MEFYTDYGTTIQLVSFHQYPDWEEVKKLDSTEKDFAQIRKDLSQTFYNVQRVHQCFLEKGNDIAALTYLRQDFENIKAKFMENIRFLNSLNFDQRNTLGQARRRELVDYAQRQIDKCTDMSTLIFHKLAQSHYISNVGKIFPRDLRIQPSRNMWLK